MIRFFIFFWTLLLFASQAKSQGISNELKNEFRNAEIVLLGEPTHGEGNVFEHKIEVVKYLHDSLGFNVMAFESGLYDMFHAQKIIDRITHLSTEEVLEEALFPIWANSLSFRPFFDFLNQRNKSLRVAGFDLQPSGPFSQKPFLDFVFQKLHSQGIENELRNVSRSILLKCLMNLSDNYTLPEGVSYQTFKKNIDSLKAGCQKLENNREKEIILLSLDNIGAYTYDCVVNKVYEKNEETFKAKNSNLRDSLMAKNILALKRMYPNEKIICWGASPHFMNYSASIKNEELKVFHSAGFYVKKELGDKVKSIAYVSSKGKQAIFSVPESVPAVADKSIEKFLANRKDIVAEQAIILNSEKWKDSLFISHCIQYKAVKANWSEIFDVLIYLPSFTPNISKLYASEVKSNRKLQQRALKIELYDKETQKPLVGRKVKVSGTHVGITNEAGALSCTANIDKERVLIEVKNYIPKDVEVSKKSILKIYLVRETKVLSKVFIRDKRFNVKKLMKKVAKTLDENYPSKSYKQKIYNNVYISNNDSTYFDVDGVADFYPLIKNKRGVHNIDFKEIQYKDKIDAKAIVRNNYTLFFPLNPSGDYLYPIETVMKNKSGKYRYEYVRTFHDEQYGTMYEVNFAQKRFGRFAIDDFKVIEHTGTLYIRKKDYAVVYVQHLTHRDIAIFNKWHEKERRKRKKLKVTRLYFNSTIIEFEELTNEHWYRYDSVLKKYIIQKIIQTHEEKGALTNRKKDKNYHVFRRQTFIDLNNVEWVNPKRLDFSKFIYYRFNAKHRPEFWSKFVIPDF